MVRFFEPRVAHVHLGDVLLEGGQLAGHQVVAGRAAGQLVGRREQEALEALRALRPVPRRVEALEALAGLQVIAAQAGLLGDLGDLAPVIPLGDRDRLGGPGLGRDLGLAAVPELADRRHGHDHERGRSHQGSEGEQPPAPVDVAPRARRAGCGRRRTLAGGGASRLDVQSLTRSPSASRRLAPALARSPPAGLALGPAALALASGVVARRGSSLASRRRDFVPSPGVRVEVRLQQVRGRERVRRGARPGAGRALGQTRGQSLVVGLHR